MQFTVQLPNGWVITLKTAQRSNQFNDIVYAIDYDSTTTNKGMSKTFRRYGADSLTTYRDRMPRLRDICKDIILKATSALSSLSEDSYKLRLLSDYGLGVETLSIVERGSTGYCINYTRRGLALYPRLLTEKKRTVAGKLAKREERFEKMARASRPVTTGARAPRAASTTPSKLELSETRAQQLAAYLKTIEPSSAARGLKKQAVQQRRASKSITGEHGCGSGAGGAPRKGTKSHRRPTRPAPKRPTRSTTVSSTTARGSSALFASVQPSQQVTRNGAVIQTNPLAQIRR